MKYRLTVTFETDEQLSEVELDGLEASIWVQVDDPQVQTEDGDWTDAAYSPYNLEIVRQEIES